MELERVPTHVDGLDSRLGGGIPKGHVVLLSGLPGTMKSSLAFSILYRNGGNSSGLYVTLEQTGDSLRRQMGAMGFAESDSRVSIVDGATLRKDVHGESPTLWRDFLHRTINRRRNVQNFQLLAIDSLEALEVLARFANPRTDLFELFEWLRSLEITTFVLTEAPPESVIFPTDALRQGDASYLADGVIHLKMHPITEVEIQRRLRVVKMRGTAHETGYLALVFEDGKFGVVPAMSV